MRRLLGSIAGRSAARLPLRWQQELRRLRFARQIASGRFRAPEPEWDVAGRWLAPGDWAVDVGANVGHYALRFSDLVGPTGRVVAIEPVPETFELLAANVVRSGCPNVTLLNMAASDRIGPLGMSIPRYDTGLRNYYQAAVTDADGGVEVLGCTIDALRIPVRVALVKVDAEGHDEAVLRGARALLERDRPVIVVESSSTETVAMLRSLGYASERIGDSPNLVYRAGGSA